MNSVTELIRAIKDSGKSQAQIAKLSGVRQATISRTLNGKTIPDTDTIMKLWKAVGREPNNYSIIAEPGHYSRDELSSALYAEIAALDILERSKLLIELREKREKKPSGKRGAA